MTHTPIRIRSGLAFSDAQRLEVEAIARDAFGQGYLAGWTAAADATERWHRTDARRRGATAGVDAFLGRVRAALSEELAELLDEPESTWTAMLLSVTTRWVGGGVVAEKWRSSSPTPRQPRRIFSKLIFGR